MKATEYRNLLFDLGNVLIDIDEPGALERMKALFKKDWSYDVLEGVILKFETGKIGTDLFINTLLSQSRPEVQALDVIEAWNSMLIGIPRYRLEMLTNLKNTYNIYLLSNTNEMHLTWIHRHLLHHHGITHFEKDFFHGTYYSHLVKDRKPNASIFQHVIEDSYLTPSNTLFLDDNANNLATAKALGFHTYQVTPKTDVAEYLKVESFY